MIRHHMRDSLIGRVAALTGSDPRSAFPPTIDVAIADRLFTAAVRGEDVAKAAGDAEFLNGYRRDRVATYDFADLRIFINRARAALRGLDQELETLQARRRQLVELLK